MIALTGAAGKTGRAIASRLSVGAVEVRALVRRETQIAPMVALGTAAPVAAMVADLEDAKALVEAFRGAKAIYHLCPNVHPEETAIGARVIAAAEAAGVDRIVYHSVLHPQLKAMAHHWQKLRVEELLIQSGLGFTILQPAAYMQNLLPQWAAIENEGRYLVPFSLDARLSLVDLHDVAEIAFQVLTEGTHGRATYELCGSRALTSHEIARALSRRLGRRIEAERQPRADWESLARASGLGSYQRTALLAMFRYYEEHGLVGHCGTLERLLGRAPTPFEAFLDRERENRRED